MVTGMLGQFTPDVNDAAAAKAAYERHNADVRANAAPERLVDWHPGDGWEPLCTALDVPVPDARLPARQHDRGVPGDDGRYGGGGIPGDR